MNVEELKDELRDKKLKVSGNKAELVDRLVREQGHPACPLGAPRGC